MKERPIIFSAPMVRAILDGRKTQTRRVVKPQPYNRGGIGHYGKGMPFIRGFEKVAECPYGYPGDRLWVRETFSLEHCVEGEDPPFSDGRPILRRPDDDVDGGRPLWVQPLYRATDPAHDLCCERPACAECRDHDMGPHWRPSIHMPRWASRITLEITGVRVERLQDITEADARAEGILRINDGWRGTPDLLWFASPVAAFRNLWASINSPESWNANPYVWVVEFRRVEHA